MVVSLLAATFPRTCLDHPIRSRRCFFPLASDWIFYAHARLLPKKILKGPSELNSENLGAQHMK